VVVFQLGGLGGEPVKVRRLDDGIAREAEIAVALIVGDDEDDVGLRRRRGCRRDGRGEGEQEGKREGAKRAR
jgi:hypothetical protein